MYIITALPCLNSSHLFVFGWLQHLINTLLVVSETQSLFSLFLCQCNKMAWHEEIQLLIPLIYVSIVTDCPGCGWNRASFLHSSLYGASFGFVIKTDGWWYTNVLAVADQCLHSKAFSASFPLPHQRAGGCANSWDSRPKLTKEVLHTVWHLYHNKSWHKKGGRGWHLQT